jgi:DNA-binding XRE family transcriptional regulator
MRSWNRCQLKLEKTTIAQLADHLGVDINEIDQKLKLREMIIRVRTRQGLTQSQLANLVGVSRSRIAQIESGVKLHRISFDILLRILQSMGYRYRISAVKLAA